MLILALIAAIAFAAWTGLFGVNARTTMRLLMRSRRARRQERVMMEVMSRKIAEAEATKGACEDRADERKSNC